MPDLAMMSWHTVGPTPLPDESAGGQRLREVLARSEAVRQFFDSAVAAGGEVLFLVNDGHRATRTREALTALAEVLGPGVKGLRVRALVATGTHRFPPGEQRVFETATFDECGWDLEEIAWHDADDTETLVEAAGVRMHRWVAAGRFLLVIGSVEPHYFAGVTGAHKTVTIGCWSRADIERNHAGAMAPSSEILRLQGNPVYDDTVAALARLRAAGKELRAINEVVRGDAIVAAAVGDPVETLTELLPIVRRVFVHPIPGPVDILRLKVPWPLGRNLYQADKALKNNHFAVRDAGGILLEADCAEGIGPDAFLKLLRRGADYATVRRIVDTEGYHLSDHKAVKLRYLTDPAGRGVHVALVSPHIPAGDAEAAGMSVFTTPEPALAWLGQVVTGPLQKGLVIEDAGVVTVAPGPRGDSVPA